MDAPLLDNGLVILDKPRGHTSHEISAFVKNITGAKRAGHAGTLDPNVSGVLPIALGRATKLLQYIAAADKTYVGIIKFRNVQAREKIESYFRQFTGEIVQTPPKMSAVRKVPRKRVVHYFSLLEISRENPRLALFEAKVGAGTYIRTLCTDIGKLCNGARMEELRRIAVGRISENESHGMNEVVDAMWALNNGKGGSAIKSIIMPPEKYIFFPRAYVKESAVGHIKSGAQVMAPGVESIDREAERGGLVAIYCGMERFLGIGRAEMNWHDLEKKKRGLAVRLERVHL